MIAAISSLIKVFVDILTPAVVEGAKLVDEGRRRELIRDILTGASPKFAGVRASIIRAGTGLAAAVKIYAKDKRLKLTGAVNERLINLENTSISLSKTDECKAYVESKSAKVELTPNFVLCWRSAWGQIEGQITALLKSADEYDQVADAGDSTAEDAFKKLTAALNTVANPTPQQLDQLWDTATRLLAFALKVETVFSKETRAKADKAIEDLVKAF